MVGGVCKIRTQKETIYILGYKKKMITEILSEGSEVHN